MPPVSELLARHGYWIVGLAVGLESMGFPLPGETMLVSAAIYAGATDQLNIAIVIAVAAGAAIVGDNAGYSIGRRFGFPLLVRYTRWSRRMTGHVKLGQLLFLRHGGKVVFFGRFIAVLRTLAAVLAGINKMPWPQFLVCNAAGAVIWTTIYGALAYLLGQRIEQLIGPIGALLGAVALIVALVLIQFIRRHEVRLRAEAEAALPGDLS